MHGPTGRPPFSKASERSRAHGPQLELALDAVDAEQSASNPRVPTDMHVASAPHTAVTRRKALGAYYTPGPMADRMVEWAVRTPADRALDPSFGGLVFLQAARARLLRLGATADAADEQLFGCDLDDDAHLSAAGDARLNLPDRALVQRDFFMAVPGVDLPRADAVVGNPPYIRYQLHNSSGASARRVAAAAGLNLNRLASSWAPFVLHAVNFVAPGGRLALVLPAELMHAQYAGEVMRWIQQRFARAALVVFEHRVFPGAMEEVVLLFAEGCGEGVCPTVGLVECESMADFDLGALRRRLATPMPPATRRGKLLAQLLPPETRELYDRLSDDDRTCTLGASASVDIGAVTGANDFFLLRPHEERDLAEELLRPAVSKAAQINGARFAAEDFERMHGLGARCWLFVSDKATSQELLATAQSYLRRGEEAGVPTRYKCRVRSPWHAVPLPKHGTPDLFLTYCSSEFPRLVVNEAGALHTNTVHGVTLRGGGDPRALAVGFYNSLTLLSAELVGRSYGGGVLKLEPTEAESLLLTPLSPHAAAKLDDVDRLLRARRLEGVLDIVDRLVLVEMLGLDERDVALLRAGGERLRARRRARSRSPK